MSEALEGRRNQVARLTKAGVPAREIAARLGVSGRTVVRDRRAAGASLAGPADRMTDAEIARAVELLEDGCSYADAAATIGRAESTVKRRCPGYKLDKSESAKRSAMGRALSRL